MSFLPILTVEIHGKEFLGEVRNCSLKRKKVVSLQAMDVQGLLSVTGSTFNWPLGDMQVV
jgi:hypothetical protein